MKYDIYDDENKLVGSTTNLTEANAYMAQAKGCRLESNTFTGAAFSSLPQLNENPVRPAGDFLKQ